MILLPESESNLTLNRRDAKRIDKGLCDVGGRDKSALVPGFMFYSEAWHEDSLRDMVALDVVAVPESQRVLDMG